MGWKIWVGAGINSLNKRKGDSLIEERLDRFVCDSGWNDRFNLSSISNISTMGFDHSLILLEIRSIEMLNLSLKKGNWRFYYEEHWGDFEDCTATVQSCWANRGNFVEKASECQAKLQHWSREKFGKSKRMNKGIGQQRSQRLKTSRAGIFLNFFLPLLPPILLLRQSLILFIRELPPTKMLYCLHLILPKKYYTLLTNFIHPTHPDLMVFRHLFFEGTGRTSVRMCSIHFLVS